ncbi:MAG: class I SAM-dependent rRNA methyltransferase [Deltaproteobacteria bacterium]|nr:MAG: class I SAM-dependent rRNA methyltransferase [Deltaproteobacteria bacterium]
MPRAQTSLTISRAASRILRKGHPWFLRESGPRPAPGTVVTLHDDKGVIAWGLADEGSIAVRVLGRGEPSSRPLAAEIADRVFRADVARTRLLDAATDSYRVVSSAGDGLPDLIVDRYGSLAVLRLYARAWEPHLDAIVQGVAALPWCATVARRLGVAKVDEGQGLQVLHGPAPADLLVVHEGDMALPVRPYVGQKTGLFLDQREHRALVRRWASGRLVANLFAYNGGFSVAAALGGAARVTTVDLAPDAVEDAREAFRLNGIDPSEHAFEVADVFAWSPRETVDFLILDPPALARGRGADAAAARAYRKLHYRFGPKIPRDGLLATSSCTARIDFGAWTELIEQCLAEHGDWSWHHRSGEPVDHPVTVCHPEGHYLKFALLRRR